MSSGVLEAFCDTVVPCLDGEPSALLGVSALDLGVPARMSPEAEAALANALGDDFASLAPADRVVRLNSRVAVGDEARLYLSGRDDGIAVPDAGAFDPIAAVLRPGDAILVKGSRSVGLEGIPDLIQKHSLAW